MKRTAVIFLFCLLTQLLIPTGLYALFGAPTQDPLPEDSSEAPSDGTAPAADTDSISVFMAEKGSVETLSLRDYLIGVVAAEMPALYEDEALKAQAAVSVTLARYMQKTGAKADLDGAVISSDYRRHQAYRDPASYKAAWGEGYDAYLKKIEAAVDAVIDHTITYDGEPILAVFHAVSDGRTESAAAVWGGDYPYLVSVDSSGDRLSSGYRDETTLSAKEFFEKLGLSVPDAPDAAVTDKLYTDAGYLKSVTVSGQTFSGLSFRQKLGLRSSAVEIGYADGVFTLVTRGYGHGVGMSQYGADYLARQGYTWKEIVAHYYPGTEIS